MKQWVSTYFNLRYNKCKTVTVRSISQGRFTGCLDSIRDIIYMLLYHYHYDVGLTNTHLLERKDKVEVL
jgi:hypothetical protein